MKNGAESSDERGNKRPTMPTAIVNRETLYYDIDREDFREVVQRLTGMARPVIPLSKRKCPKPVVTRLQQSVPPPPLPAFSTSTLLQARLLPSPASGYKKTPLPIISPLKISGAPLLTPGSHAIWTSLIDSPGTASMRRLAEGMLLDAQYGEASANGGGLGATPSEAAWLPFIRGTPSNLSPLFCNRLS